MRRHTFGMGDAREFKHQKPTVEWVRQRLADSGGCVFKHGATKENQWGVILADGVGMGKTYEALAGAALILLETTGKTREDSNPRVTNRRKAAHVLVVCPPGLVTKWQRELNREDGFCRLLRKWAKSDARKKFIESTFTGKGGGKNSEYVIAAIRRQRDLPKPTRKGSARVFPPGVYICSWNIIKKPAPGRSRISEFKKQPWDVIIVDEGHHKEAKAALDTISCHGRSKARRPVLVLTATPFQLNPKQIDDLTKKLKDGKGLFGGVGGVREVREFGKAVDEIYSNNFGKDFKPQGLKQKKKAAEGCLRQIVARNHSRGWRHYYFLNHDGLASAVPSPCAMNEKECRQEMENAIKPRPEFQEWYLRAHQALARSERDFPSMRLRQALSTPAQAARAVRPAQEPPYSPRLRALSAWALKKFKGSLLAFVKDGMPRKTLVFTSFVGEKEGGGAVAGLRQCLDDAMREAWASVRKEPTWRKMREEARNGLDGVIEAIRDISQCEDGRGDSSFTALQTAIKALDKNCLAWDMFGSKAYCKAFITEVRQKKTELERLTNARDRLIEACPKGARNSADSARTWAKFHEREKTQISKSIAGLCRTDLVLTYTGHDDQKERDTAGDAFQSLACPWVLVASNIGSEGIDLQTYTTHLVHFDLEWNPARMEQREGRMDRLGRKTKDPMCIYYLLVKGTYDERMFYQFIARQRWHAVLLGKSAARLQTDRPQKGDPDVRFISSTEAKGLSLDLSPRNDKK